jgi:hypothetical protein
VIVEKPMALSTSDAEKMIETARKNNVKLCISHQNRFNPTIRRLRRAVEEGRFGRIIAGNARILWNRGYDYYHQAPWRGTYDQDGGCLMNQCIHDIDLLQWMLGGEAEWVHGAVGNYIHSFIEAEDYGSIQIRFKNGAIGSVEGTVCVYPRNLEETLTIIGEKGVVSLGGLAVNKIETTMASFGLLMPAGSPIGSGGLFTPGAMAFGPDGNLYISGGTFGGNLGVRRYNPTTGAFIDFFAKTGNDLYVPIGIAFGPDNNLYVATQNAANVMRFSYPAGTFMDFFVPDGGGGLTAPFHLTFDRSRKKSRHVKRSP